jgi:phosphosulfolactate synthase (CoM biosynthesis protein A)
MERAAAGDAAAKELLKRLRSVGNEELLAKIAERLRQIAARLDRGESYSDLEGSESEAGEDVLSEMSEEELKDLLAQLDQLAGMKDLEKMLRNGNGELRGGRKLRLDGLGGT